MKESNIGTKNHKLLSEFEDAPVQYPHTFITPILLHAHTVVAGHGVLLFL